MDEGLRTARTVSPIFPPEVRYVTVSHEKSGYEVGNIVDDRLGK